MANLTPHWRAAGLIDNQSHSLPDSDVRLDQLPLRRTTRIASIAWEELTEAAARRLRELGFDEGVAIETLHRGPMGLGPIACRVGRMTIALRTAQAAAVLVEPV